MNNIKNVFTIKDLENLSGIKAHTIRIWEKRYAILEPMRTENNIRYYDSKSLQKLLNICTLHSFGYKISAISKITDEKLPVMVREILSVKNMQNHVLNSFKLSMMNFDPTVFAETYNDLLQAYSFREIFYTFFIPLLEEIGILWQTSTITPAHEHFISALIKQKIAANTEGLPAVTTPKSDRTYILYLPENEIHEIGLMFINYELILNGYKTVYLGESVPIENVQDAKNYFTDITYITYVTINPSGGTINNYLTSFKEHILNDDKTELYIFGRKTANIENGVTGRNIKIFGSINAFTEGLY
jgi:methanogenic corrinoid protein MtbC1